MNVRLFASLVIPLFFHVTARAGYPISFSEVNPPYGGRLWVPCGAQQCLLDTGGRGSMLPVDEETLKLPKIGIKNIVTIKANMSCDILKPIDFEFAGRKLSAVSFVRCADSPSFYSAMLGLNVLHGKRFKIAFSNSEFTWVKRREHLRHQVLNVEGWIAIKVQVGPVALAGVFDTGAPMTLVDEQFVSDHPDLFSEPTPSPLPGIDLRMVLAPMSIAGHSLLANTVMVLNLKEYFGADVPQIFLGMNQIIDLDWNFDLVKNVFDVSGPYVIEAR